MARKKQKPKALHAWSADRRLRDALEQVRSLKVRRRWAEVRALLEDLDRTYPQRQEILRALVEVAFALNDAHVYQYACEKLYALSPQDRHLPYMLTRAYVQNSWLGLALMMGRLALAQDPANEKAAATRRLLDELEPLLNQEIARLELTGEDGLECLLLHDQVRSFLDQGRYARAREVAEQLATRRPRFAPAYNNGAEACFHDGQPAQAIALLQRLLQHEPDNVFALANLVRFLSVTGQVEEARGHAQRLLALPAVAKPLAVKQAEALAWLGDDAGVLAVFERGRDLESVEGPEDDALLYHLAAVAAFRQGREEEARGCWQAALQAVPYFELAQSNLDDLRRPISERNAPWSYSFNYFVPRKLVEDLLARVASARGKDKDAAVQREAQRFLTTHPELEGLVPLLLDRGDGAGRELALQLAGLLRTPAMLQAVRDFALGQRGSDKLRLQAVQLAEQAGVFPAGPRRIWIDGGWRTTKMQRFEIHGGAVEHSFAAGVFELVNRGIAAIRGGDAAGAERVLRQAQTIDPDDPVVLNNLAVACANLGRTDESEAISNGLLERHPDYLFARTALASLAAERGQLERARELLAPLLERRRLHIGEFSALCLAQINLYFAESNREQVQHWMGMLRDVVPEHPALESFETRLRAMPR